MNNRQTTALKIVVGFVLVILLLQLQLPKYPLMFGGLSTIAISTFIPLVTSYTLVGGIVLLATETADSCLIENQSGQNWDECGGSLAFDVFVYLVYLSIIRWGAKRIRT